MDQLAHTAKYEVIIEYIGLIIREVLNSEEIFPLVYKSVSIPLMLYNLGKVTNNTLVIGKDKCWLVVAKTCHPNYFLGTERYIGHKVKG